MLYIGKLVKRQLVVRFSKLTTAQGWVTGPCLRQELIKLIPVQDNTL